MRGGATKRGSRAIDSRLKTPSLMELAWSKEKSPLANTAVGIGNPAR